MEFPPLLRIKSHQEKIDSSFEIKQRDSIYILNIKANDDYLTLKISVKNTLLDNYETKLTITDIQEKHKTFNHYSSFKKFVDYIKSKIENNKFEILKKDEESILIRLTQENIEFIAKKKKLDKETIRNIKEKYEKLFEDNKNKNEEIQGIRALNDELKKENEKIKSEIRQLEEENKNLKDANKDLELKIRKYNSRDHDNNNIINIIDEQKEFKGFHKKNKSNESIEESALIHKEKKFEDNKIKKFSIDNKKEEISKVNLKDLNQNYYATPNKYNQKNIYFDNQSNQNDNNKNIQNKKYNYNYKTNTENKPYSFNKILNNIYLRINNLFNSDENKKEDNTMINKKNMPIMFINNFNKYKLKPKYNLNNYSNIIKNHKGSKIINATLQCLTNVEQLVKYFLSNREEIRKKNNKHLFSNALLEMIENLWENKSIEYYSPIYFVDMILNQKINFNSEELIKFILDNLNKELNKAKDINLDYKNVFYDDFESYYQNSEKDYNKKFRSIISDIFYLKYDSEITCFECGKEYHDIQLKNILELSLEDVKKCYNKNKKFIYINECLKCYKKQNLIKCNKCNFDKAKGNINILLKIPKVLIISINIKKNSENKLQINDEINLNDCFYNKEKKYKYELRNIMAYLEKDNYIAYCKSFVDNKWYEYFDSKISEKCPREAKNKGTPYLLFYSLKDN